MAQGKIPVMITGQVLATVGKERGKEKINIARVLVPVPGDMPEVVDVRGWPLDWSPAQTGGDTVTFSATINAWSMDGRSGVSVNFTSLYQTRKAEKASG